MQSAATQTPVIKTSKYEIYKGPPDNDSLLINYN